MSYKLEQPYTDIEKADFIVEYNHKKNLKIVENNNTIFALEANEIMGTDGSSTLIMKQNLHKKKLNALVS